MTNPSAKVAYIGLGANLGNRWWALSQAKKRLAAAPGVKFEAASSLYETAPLGDVAQPNFLNAAVRVRTTLAPRQLLALLSEIELALGRERGRPKGPRLIDCDLLLLAQEVLVEDGLVIPHPELTGRLFVLVPLLELDPTLRHPGTGMPLSAYRQLVMQQEGRRQYVRLMEGVGW